MTFSEVIAQQDLVARISGTVRGLIRESSTQAEQFGRVSLNVLPSCTTCTAEKGCCKLATLAYLYEGVPISARLIRDGRDTPELRGELAAAAEAMETTRPIDYNRPCVFLDAQERCTIYEDRPSECGAAFVYSPPEACSSRDPESRIQKFPAPLLQISSDLEPAFVRGAGLRRTDHPYSGALPRMVLLCLEAWDRTDYVEFLSEHGRRAAFAYADMVGLR